MKIANSMFFLALLFMFSCTENSDTFTPIEGDPQVPDLIIYTPEIENITATVRGFVVDELKSPIANALVSIGSKNTTTDEYGHFLFENMALNAKGTVVQIEKGGYFSGSRRFFPLESGENRIKIELLDKNFDYSIVSKEGGNVTTQNGAAIDFLANSILLENGDEYNGEVKIAVRWLDPSSEATLDRMPGNLQGINAESQQVALATYGMLAVELQGADGEYLNINTDKPATITMPVPARLLDHAPSEIPLWSFDENYGLWKQEATAYLNDGKYIGEVEHFSFWNCDVPYDLVKIDLQLIDNQDNNISNLKVAICADGIEFVGTGYTSSEGTLSVLVPADRALALKLYDACEEVIHTENLGSFIEDQQLGTIKIASTSIKTSSITGQLINCNGNDISNGVIILTYNNNTQHYFLYNGNFVIQLNGICNDTDKYDISFIDIESQFQTNLYNISIDNNTDFGQISVCDQALENFIEVTIDGVTELYFSPYISTSQGSNTFIESNINEYYIGFGFEGVSAGDYSTRNSLEAIYHDKNGWNFNSGTFDFFFVSSYDEIPGVIKGTFIGEFTNGFDSNGPKVEVSGSFEVLR